MITVTFFCVLQPNGNETPVQTVHESFGTDIPQYLYLDDGEPRGKRYVFCVSQDYRELESFCSVYGYYNGTPAIAEVDDALFNAQHKIVIDMNNVATGGFSLVPI